MGRHETRIVHAALTLTGCLATTAHADQPLPPPADHVICSANGVHCAVMDVAANRIQVVSDGQVTWQMAGWFRDAYVADDGAHMVVGYDGLNLLQMNYRPDTVMITFLRRGAIIHEVPIAALIDDFESLEETVSHFHWGMMLGIDETGQFIVQTVEDRRIAFDVTTGAVVGITETASP